MLERDTALRETDKKLVKKYLYAVLSCISPLHVCVLGGGGVEGEREGVCVCVCEGVSV